MPSQIQRTATTYCTKIVKKRSLKLNRTRAIQLAFEEARTGIEIIHSEEDYKRQVKINFQDKKKTPGGEGEGVLGRTFLSHGIQLYQLDDVCRTAVKNLLFLSLCV